MKDIEKTIEKLKLQEKRLLDLYLSSNLDVETINHKNDVIKKKIRFLNAIINDNNIGIKFHKEIVLNEYVFV